MNQPTAYRLPPEGLITTKILSLLSRWLSDDGRQAKASHSRKA
jgi:hypothetical protein